MIMEAAMLLRFRVQGPFRVWGSGRISLGIRVSSQGFIESYLGFSGPYHW